MLSELAKNRFRQKVRTDGPGGCHVWTGARNIWGYGRLKCDGVMLSAHRVAWELANGLIPDGQSVLHRCDVRRCVNPAHLFLGTQEDNMRDMFAKGRQAKGHRLDDVLYRRDQITVPIDRALREEIERAAAAECRSMSGQIRHWILDALAARQGQSQQPARA
jgi:hypothetical protein